MAKQKQEASGLLRSLLEASTAAAIAETLTIPADTAKVRLQLQNSSGTGARRYRGPFQTMRVIVQEEGARAPFKGWVPGLQRQVLFTGLRLGLYDRVKDAFSRGQQGEAPLYAKLGAALCTSAIGITVANPADLVKVRLQACEHPTYLSFTASRGGGVLEEHGPTYKSATEAYTRIVREEGLRGLWKGYLPNLVRNCVISATELVTYDQAKTYMTQRLAFQDGIAVHLACGLSAGLAATLIGSPWDVIGTRLMAVTKQAKGKDAPPKQLLAFIGHMARTEGISSFWKGFWPNYARIGSFNVVLWLSYEQIKHLTHKDHH